MTYTAGAGEPEVGHRALNVRPVKALVRRLRHRVRGAWIRRFGRFSIADLRAGLIRLGIANGDVVFVHSSWDAFDGFTGRPTDVISLLQELVGAGGILMMPTLPFTGTAVEYANTGAVFDVARTPSRMGLLTELFRRSPGVQRSVHPTHPVAVWGNSAGDVVRDHHLARTPCGHPSPYASLVRENGKILLMGTDIGILTFYHYVEEVIERKLPRSPFTQEQYCLRSRRPDGQVVETVTRLFEPSVSRRRNLTCLIRPLRQRGALTAWRIGRLPLTVLHAATVVEVARDLAARGIYCYD